MNIKHVLLTVAVLLLSIPAFAGPKKYDFPLTMAFYKDVLGDPDNKSYHCFYAGPNSRYDNNIACPQYSNVEVHLYAVGTINGQKHTYRIEFQHGDALPTLALHPDPHQPQPPVNNIFPARLDGKHALQILALRNGKLVTVKVRIIYEQ